MFNYVLRIELCPTKHMDHSTNIYWSPLCGWHCARITEVGETVLPGPHGKAEGALMQVICTHRAEIVERVVPLRCLINAVGIEFKDFLREVEAPLCIAKPNWDECLGLQGRIVGQIMFHTTLKMFNLGKASKEHVDFRCGQLKSETLTIIPFLCSAPRLPVWTSDADLSKALKFSFSDFNKSCYFCLERSRPHGLQTNSSLHPGGASSVSLVGLWASPHSTCHIVM